MTELPDTIEQAIDTYLDARLAYWEWQDHFTGPKPDPEQAKLAMIATIFDALVLQREMGREEGYVEWDDDDPVGRFIKDRHDAKQVIDPLVITRTISDYWDDAVEEGER